MCDELKTHTDGSRGLCKSHAYEVKQAGGAVALELGPEGTTCEWVDSTEPEPDPEPGEDSHESEQTEE